MAALRPTLETGRLILKPLTLEDEEAIEDLLKDPRIARMTTSISFPNPKGETLAFLKRVIDPENLDITWSIRMNERVLGVITLRGSGEMGYWLGPEHWGAGIMTEAGEAVITHAIERGDTRVHAQHFFDNPASGRVMEKLGMTRIGEGTRMFSKARNETVRQVLYERLL